MLETIILAAGTSFGLIVVGADYAFILGVIAGIGNIIPYVGPLIGIIPAFITFYVQTQSFNAILIISIIFLVLQLLDNIILKPIIYSHSVDLHPLTVLISILLGGVLAGVWGLVVAVPVAGAIKVISTQLSKEWQYRTRRRFELS